MADGCLVPVEMLKILPVGLLRLRQEIGPLVWREAQDSWHNFQASPWVQVEVGFHH